MNTVLSDAQAVAAKIDGHVKSCQTGAEASLKAGSHPQARMFGSVGPDRFDVLICGGTDQAVAKAPTVNNDARILSIDIEG